MYYCFFDGGSRGNPGQAACGIHIRHGNKVLHEDSKFLGVLTNNQAEYEGLLFLLRYIKDHIPEGETLDISGDSQLVIYQVTGKYGTFDPKLRPLLQQVQQLLSELKHSIAFKCVPRTENANADKLVNMELDKRVKAAEQTHTITKSSLEKHVKYLNALQEIKRRCALSEPLTRGELIKLCDEALRE